MQPSDIKKRDAFSWSCRTNTHHVYIGKYSGGLPGLPYYWEVYPLPKPAGRWAPLAKGCARNVTEAKRQAISAIGAA